MTHLLAVLALSVPHLDQLGDPLPPGAIARFGTVRFRVGSDRVRYSHALSPDGKFLAVEDRDGICLWDTDTGRVARHLPWRASQGNSPKFGLCFSPDGKRLARMAGRVVAVWDLATGTEIFDIDYKEEGEFQAIAFVPGKDRLVVTAVQKPQSWTLDARTGSVIRATEFEGKHWALEPAGPFLMDRVGSDWTLYDPDTGKERVRFSSRNARGDSFTLSPDGRWAWVADADGVLRQFDVATGEQVAAAGPPPGWRPDTESTAVALSPDGNVVFCANGNRGVYRRDVKAGRWLDPIPNVPAGALLPHPDGKRLLVVGTDGILRRYDLATRQELPVPDGFGGPILAFPSPDGRRIALVSGSDVKRLAVVDPAGRLQWEGGLYGFGCVPRWSPDGRRLAVVEQRTIRSLDPRTGKGLGTLEVPDKFFEHHDSVGWSPDGNRMIVPLDGGSGIAEYDLATRTVPRLHKPGIRGAAATSPDGRTVAYTSEDEGVRLFDLAAGRFATGLIDPPTGEEHNATGTPGFTPDGSGLLTWELEPQPEGRRPRGVTLVLRDPRTGARRDVHELGLNTDFLWAVSPDGLWLAVGDRSGKFHLYDLATGHALGRWEGHRSAVTSIGFAGPGRVLTASGDLTALLWDVRPRTAPAGSVWDALRGRDGMEAWRAVWALAADPNAPALVRDRIPVAAVPPAVRVQRWLTDLGADRYAVREAATKALHDLGRLIEPDLRAVRDRATSEEVRTRLDGLLAKVSAARTPAELVQARAVAAMEAAGTPAARKLLAEWAAGPPGARLTVDAKAALARLAPTR